jgi:hypothetical protein
VEALTISHSIKAVELCGQLANIYLTLCELCRIELPCEGIETAASLIPLSGGGKRITRSQKIWMSILLQ